MKKNKRKLIHYVKFDKSGISVPAHRIVRSEGFQKSLEAIKRIMKKKKDE